MTSIAAVVGTLATGAALSVLAVVGGVSVATPDANPVSKSEQVVLYDAP